MMNRSLLALAALVLCAGCSTPWFEPTPNWWREGGRLCAANREPLSVEPRAAPRACALTQAHAPREARKVES